MMWNIGSAAIQIVICSTLLGFIKAEIPPRCDTPIAEWTIEKQNIVPPARAGAITATTPSGDLWMFGGWGENVVNDFWKFESKNRTWTSVTVSGLVPEARYMGHGCYYKDKFVIFGGESGDPIHTFSDVWMYHEKTKNWTEIPLNDTGPGPRASAASWCSNSSMIIFGGYQRENKVSYQDTWILEFEDSVKWIQIETDYMPSPRYGSVTWTGQNHTNLFMFGGGIGIPPNGEQIYNDMWQFCMVSKNFTRLQSNWSSRNDNITVGYYGDMQKGDLVGRPGGRMWASSWTDDCGYLWLFSGNGLGEVDSYFGIQSDIWYFIPSENVWISSGGFQMTNMQKGANRYGEASIDNFPGSRWLCTAWSVNNDMYLFGGNTYDNQNTAINDLWRLTWRSLRFVPRVTAKPTEPPEVYIWSFLVAGIIVISLILIAIIRKCVCKKGPVTKQRHAKVKYQKLSTEA